MLLFSEDDQNSQPDESDGHREKAGSTLAFLQHEMETDEDADSASSSDDSEDRYPSQLAIVADTLGALSNSQAEVGSGGFRGSRVYEVTFSQLQQLGVTDEKIGKVLAYKLYPNQISEEELNFFQAISSTRASLRYLPDDFTHEIYYGFLHLAVPSALVRSRGELRGILMPLFKCSLKFFLETYSPLTSFDDIQEEGLPHSSFKCSQQFTPVCSVPVIAALAYQLLSAIHLLHCQLMSHDGSPLNGYTHKDIHLDNVLLNDTGKLALCDFELVSPIAHSDCSSPSRFKEGKRIPAFSRQSPTGLFTPSADVWALGIFIVNLMTGVDPLFSDESLQNDFGNGPFLGKYSDNPNCLDWDGNIAAHVQCLLTRSNTLAWEGAGDLLRLCSRCLVNCEGKEPATTEELLQDTIFRMFNEKPFDAEKVVAEWITHISSSRKHSGDDSSSHGSPYSLGLEFQMAGDGI